MRRDIVNTGGDNPTFPSPTVPKVNRLIPPLPNDHFKFHNTQIPPSLIIWMGFLDLMWSGDISGLVLYWTLFVRIGGEHCVVIVLLYVKVESQGLYRRLRGDTNRRKMYSKKA